METIIPLGMCSQISKRGKLLKEISVSVKFSFICTFYIDKFLKY